MNILGLLRAAFEIHLTPTGVATAFSIGWNHFNEVWLDQSTASVADSQESLGSYAFIPWYIPVLNTEAFIETLQSLAKLSLFSTGFISCLADL